MYHAANLLSSLWVCEPDAASVKVQMARFGTASSMIVPLKSYLRMSAFEHGHCFI